MPKVSDDQQSIVMSTPTYSHVKVIQVVLQAKVRFNISVKWSHQLLCGFAIPTTSLGAPRREVHRWRSRSLARVLHRQCIALFVVLEVTNVRPCGTIELQVRRQPLLDPLPLGFRRNCATCGNNVQIKAAPRSDAGIGVRGAGGDGIRTMDGGRSKSACLMVGRRRARGSRCEETSHGSGQDDRSRTLRAR